MCSGCSKSSACRTKSCVTRAIRRRCSRRRELKSIHPLGKSPVVTDGSATLAESGAIVEYLVGHYGDGRLVPPPGTPERLRYTYWLHYAEGSAMPPLLMKLVFDRVGASRMPFFARPIVRGVVARVNWALLGPQLALHLDYMEGELAKSTWFAGEDFTAADIQMSFPIEAARARAGLDAGRPRLWAFLERVRNRPAYQAALARGGTYELAR